MGTGSCFVGFGMFLRIFQRNLSKVVAIRIVFFLIGVKYSVLSFQF